MRYFRLTPAYAAVIALAFVFPLLSSGPLWHETVDAVAEPCYESWWTNLLYVNNFVKTEKLVRFELALGCILTTCPFFPVLASGIQLPGARVCVRLLLLCDAVPDAQLVSE